MVGQRETGNERYVASLVSGLAKVDPENQYEILVTDPRPLEAMPTLPANFRRQVVRPGGNILRTAWATPRTCRRVAADVLHVSYTAPPICPCAIVLTVHDISFALFPSFFSLRDRLLLSASVPLSCRLATRIIAVSEQTKRDLVRQYAVPPQKIKVVHEAVDERFSNRASADEALRTRRKYAGGRRYVLALGNIQPRKNLGRLVEAYALLTSAGMVAEDIALVIAGQAQRGASEVFDQVAARGLADKVCFPGYVADDDLPALYRGAEVFVHPSLYEGFGLPPLEAMACGTPVVCSNASALPEVIGQGAALVDPYDTDALAETLGTLLNDGARRRDLSASGLARAAQFSWERTAQETLQVYREAAGG